MSLLRGSQNQKIYNRGRRKKVYRGTKLVLAVGESEEWTGHLRKVVQTNPQIPGQLGSAFGTVSSYDEIGIYPDTYIFSGILLPSAWVAGLSSKAFIDSIDTCLHDASFELINPNA